MTGVQTCALPICSMGNTGFNSHYVYDYIGKLCDNAGVDIKEVCEKSSCLSSDVNAAYDPVFADAYEAQNSCYLNHGGIGKDIQPRKN